MLLRRSYSCQFVNRIDYKEVRSLIRLSAGVSLGYRSKIKYILKGAYRVLLKFQAVVQASEKQLDTQPYRQRVVHLLLVQFLFELYISCHAQRECRRWQLRFFICLSSIDL